MVNLPRKKLLPIIIIFFTIFYVAYWLITQRNKRIYEVEKPIKIENDLGVLKKDKDDFDIEIDNVTFSDKKANDVAYNFAAQKAVKIKNGEYIVEKVAGEIDIGKTNLYIDAIHGDFHEEDENLIFDDQINAKYLGYILTGNHLEISLKEKNLLFKNGIKLYNEKLQITANKLKTKGEEIVEFEGDVKTIINLSP